MAGASYLWLPVAREKPSAHADPARDVAEFYRRALAISAGRTLVWIWWINRTREACIQRPTVVSGGLVPMTLLAAGVGSSTALPGATGIALLIAGLTAIGLLDDKWGLPSAIRLLCYLCAGIALPWLLSSDLPLGTTTLLLTGVAVAWCINLVNFMDGADGLATVQALCVATGLGLIATFGAAPNAILAWLCALLLACCAPLLGFNWPPAKLFMGDAGAVPLGFFLAVLGLLAFATDMCGWLGLVNTDDAFFSGYRHDAVYSKLSGQTAACGSS